MSIVSDFISGMGLFSKLLERRSEKNKKRREEFISFVDQTYCQLEAVHQSYINHFVAYRDSLLQSDSIDIVEFKRSLIRDSALTESDRAKLVALRRQIRKLIPEKKKEMGSEIDEFIFSTFEYLRLSESQIEYNEMTNIHRDELLRVITMVSDSSEIAVQAIDDGLSHLQSKFKIVTHAYYNLKSRYPE